MTKEEQPFRKRNPQFWPRRIGFAFLVLACLAAWALLGHEYGLLLFILGLLVGTLLALIFPRE